MNKYDYDLFVIGAGSGGVRASRISSELGAHVAIAEERYFGGTCVNVGCIPKKLLAYAAHFSDDFADAETFGWGIKEPRFDWSKLIANKDKEIERLNGVYQRVLESAGVEIIRGRAVLAGPHMVRVGNRNLSARYILVASGGWPTVPAIPGAEHAITSNEAFYLEKLPRRVIVIGGGYIAVEFASIFNGLGSEVTQVYRGLHLLRGFDRDIAVFLTEEMRKKSVDFLFNTDIGKISKGKRAFTVCMTDGNEIEAEVVMYATGRAPNTRDLGLENAGVELAENGAIKVDDYFCTSAKSVYAIGDVIDRVKLTPVALAEAMALADTLFNSRPTKMDYSNIATAVFSNPQIGTVGLTEAAARERCAAIDVYATTFRPLKLTLGQRAEKTLMKLVVERETDRVLGAHMVGPEAGEIMQGFAVALKLGATKAQFDATVGIHPTAAEELVALREKLPERKGDAA
jgi:glutathione reductase (NADPH)